MIKNAIFVLLIIAASFILTSCSKDPKNDKGIGPVNSVSLSEIKKDLAMQGKGIFDEKCSTCHRMDVNGVGPSLKNVTLRRTPEWIMNMILNPEQMIEENITAKKLSENFMMHMKPLGLTEQNARAVLEYLRFFDSGNK
jgi:mono/diheme cytochrome c family protein